MEKSGESFEVIVEEDIQITNIEAELNRLWEQHKTEDRVRACLFTLLIYAQTKEAGIALKELMKLILQRYPCRIIFIQEGQLDNTLKVDVSNEIVSEEEKEVACDIIYIETDTSQLHRVPFIVLPHFVPDLPIYYLWGQDPSLDTKILPALGRYSNRLIFNRDHKNDFNLFAQNILKLIHNTPHQEFIDISWLNTMPWRNALKHAFELQKTFAWLQISNKIQIHYTQNESQKNSSLECQVVYLISWLASLMHWEFVKKETADKMTTLKFSSNNNECTLYLSPEKHPEYSDGTIVRMELSSYDEHFISITPIHDTAKALVHIASYEACELPYHIPLNLKLTLPDVHSLLYHPMGSHYPLMLEKMASIHW